MQTKVKELLTMNIQDILQSPEFLVKLIRTYSNIYLNGAQCSTCEKSVISYYNKLKKNGIMDAKKIDEKKNKCNKKGLVYIPKLGRHVNLETMTDADALYLVEIKVLEKSDFSYLPKVEFIGNITEQKKADEPKKNFKKKV